VGDGTRIRPHKSQPGEGGSDGRQGCTQHRGLRFCSIRVFTAAFQASGDSIHPLGIRLDCSPPRPTHVHTRPFRDVHKEQNPSEPYMLPSLHNAHGADHLSALQRARAARARWGQLVSGLYHMMTSLVSQQSSTCLISGKKFLLFFSFLSIKLRTVTKQSVWFQL
jgi:hypothetical protein